MIQANVQAALLALEPALASPDIGDPAREVMTRRTLPKIDAVLATLGVDGPLLRQSVIVPRIFVQRLQEALLNERAVAAVEAEIGAAAAAVIFSEIASL